MTGDLSTARARLQELEGQAVSLQAQADTEAQALTAAQDAASTGRGPLRLVAAAQGLADAARGVLSLHLGKVQQQRAQVQELERAHGVAQLVERGRAAQDEATRAAHDAAQLITEVEATLADALARFQALQGTYSAARGTVWQLAQEHAAQAVSLPQGVSVADFVQSNQQHRVSHLGADMRAAVADALSSYGAEVGTSGRDLHSTANRTAPRLAPGPLGILHPNL